MTAVANPPSYQQISRSTWGANGSQGLSSMNPDEVSRMFMPRKSAQRANSSSSVSSNSSSSSSGSSTATFTQTAQQINGGAVQANGDSGGWGTAALRKKPPRSGPWPSSKAEAMSGVTTARPQSILATNGASAASSMSSIHQSNGLVSSQQMLQNTSQQNGVRQGIQQSDTNPMLYLLSMNGTFERKTISVPIYPDVLRIGRQTNIKTVPTPSNGFFDSKVLSRQHAEIWADRTGKVWIRDVRSSNGTFVNGTRLSAENRDSEPHELQTQDHLELGIDIVSEDQKTVVHHKVAAKVEHAGFLDATNNVLDMNFGDLDPANGIMMQPQNGSQTRGRSSSQGSVGCNGRAGPTASAASTNMSMGQHKPMHYWLTPVTTEQIVKRLKHEMRAAQLQNQDLKRTEGFVGALVSGDDVRISEKPAVVEPSKPVSLSGSMSFKLDAKARFTDPPAPPPQQPLPEKPDVARSQQHDPLSPSLRRSTTERPRSVPSASPVRPGLDLQMTSLVEALQLAKKEIDAQNSKVRTLEELLQRERSARESAEVLARKLEMESGARMNGSATSVGGTIIEDTFEPPEPLEDAIVKEVELVSVETVEKSTMQLQHRLDSMLVEMQEMKKHMEAYRTRAETAEKERDEDRKTLSEMVSQIRSEEQARRSSSTTRGRSPAKTTLLSSKVSEPNGSASRSKSLLDLTKDGGKLSSLQPSLAAALRPPGHQDQLLYHSTPYASMLGVVLLGMGLMAYMNGWQKVER